MPTGTSAFPDSSSVAFRPSPFVKNADGDVGVPRLLVRGLSSVAFCPSPFVKDADRDVGVPRLLVRGFSSVAYRERVTNKQW